MKTILLILTIMLVLVSSSIVSAAIMIHALEERAKPSVALYSSKTFSPEEFKKLPAVEKFRIVRDTFVDNIKEKALPDSSIPITNIYWFMFAVKHMETGLSVSYSDRDLLADLEKEQRECGRAK